MADAGTKFVWPPAKSRRPVPSPREIEANIARAAEAEAPPPPVPATAWHRIERAWLDVQLESWPSRRARADWRPWAEGAYCTRCGQAVGPGEADKEGCAQCRTHRCPWRRLVTLGPYKPPLDQAIRDVKFQGMRRIGMQLGRALGERLQEVLRKAALIQHPIYLVPVPTSFRRRLSRGIDHGVVIANAAAVACDGRVLNLLSRRHRPRQLEVARSLRERNAAGSMLPRRGVIANPWRRLVESGARERPALLVLIDDVITTGATLRAASRTLIRGCKAAGVPAPELWAAVLAATPSWQVGREGAL